MQFDVITLVNYGDIAIIGINQGDKKMNRYTLEQMLRKVSRMIGNDHLQNPTYQDSVEVGETISFVAKSADDTYGGMKIRFVKIDDSLWEELEEIPSPHRGANVTIKDRHGVVLHQTASDTLRFADLSGLNLTESRLLDEDLTSSDLSYANLNGAIFEQCILHGINLEHAKLSGSKMGRQSLFRAKMDFADMSGVDLSRGNITLTSAVCADFGNANLDHAGVDDTNMDGARLVNASFKSAWIDGVNFANADLTGANFEFATIRATTFPKATLKNVRFYKTEFIGVNLDGVDLSECNIAGATFAD